jgi:hypothetical protein
MAITSATATSFKVDILKGLHAFGTSVTRAGTAADTFYAALYTSSATMDATTTAYTVTNESSGTGYTAGGMAIAIVQAPTSTSTTAWMDFTDTTWSTSTVTARGMMVYNFTASGKNTVMVLDFGADKTSTAGNFTIVWPVGDSSTAIIRIA